MKQQYQLNQDNLDHVCEYNHFADNYSDKPQCKYGQDCKAYIRSETGTDLNRIDDKCHLNLYRHPPRTRQIKLQENIHSLVINKSKEQNHPLYSPTDEVWDKYGGDWLRPLIDEVIGNGFGYDLCLKCGKDDKCKHNVYKSQYSILKIVDEKIKCKRHRLMGSPLSRDEMLALILYTGDTVSVPFSLYILFIIILIFRL